MRHFRLLPAGFTIIASCVAQGLMAQSPFPDFYGEPINRNISFWKNHGQEVDTDGNPRPDVKFISEGTQPKVYLRDKSTVSLAFGISSGENEVIDQLARIDVKAVGREAASTIPSGLIIRDHVKHFWLEHSMPDQIQSVPGYGWVKYSSVYPGIDWHWYGGSSGTKMAFVCQPGSDPENITLSFSGQDSLKIDWEGALKIHLEQKWLKFEEAKAYQYDVFGNITILSWGASYELVEGQPQVKFYYSNYDPAKPLVFFVGFPPLNLGGGPNDGIPYSTYLGTGMKDEVNEIAVAANGDYYTVGDIEDHQFPASVGLVADWVPNQTGFIAKFDANYVRKWVGYYGRKLSSIALDEFNQRIVVGASRNSSIYTQQFGSGYLLTQGGGCAVAMISMETPSSPPSLLWSTRWSASTLTKVLVDREGRIYLAGSVYQSNPYVVQPPTGSNPFYQATHHGQRDGYLACFDANTNLLWSTLYGGEGEDEILDMAINEDINRLAVVGRTKSSGHPGAGNCIVQNGWLPQCGGGGAYNQTYCNSNGQNCSLNEDGFIAMFALNLDWTWSTRFGGPSIDRITSAVFAPNGDLYVAGYSGSQQTYSSNDCGVPDPNAQGFPHCVWTQAADQDSYGGLDDHFIACFGTDRILKWSRFVGGPGYEFASILTSDNNDTYPVHGPVIAVDDAGDIFLAGSTTSGGSTHSNGYIFTPQNSQYYQSSNSNGLLETPPTDRSDVYVMKMNGADGEVQYGAYYGGLYGVPLNWPGWSLNSDVVTCVTVRDSRLFIGGSTASTLFFPVNASDGVATSFQQFTPPANQFAGATDLTHGFVAQLSWLYEPVGIRAVEVQEQVIVASFGSDGQLSVLLPTDMPRGGRVVDLFDALGKLVGSFTIQSFDGVAKLPTAHLGAGLYTGRIRETNVTFKAAKS